MKKKQRKSNGKNVLTYPTTTYFTIQDVVELNPKMLTASKSDITIRVRLTNAKEAGKIAEIGALPGGKGRPPKVYTFTPVTQIALNKAKANNINLVDNSERLVHAVSVSTKATSISTPAVMTIPTTTVKVS